MKARTVVSSSILGSLVFASFSAMAAYNANMTGVVTAVLTYTEQDQIYFKLSTQPSTHPSCNPSLFAIPAETPADRRKALLAQLLTAKVTGVPINIGYDNAGDCAHGYIRVHRAG